MKHSKLVRLLSVIIVLMLVSCSSGVKQSDLIGKWTQTDSQTVMGLPATSIEFFTDGKVMIADKYPGTFKLLDDGKLQVTLPEGVYSGAIKISGKTLTITKDDGVSKSYIKQ